MHIFFAKKNHRKNNELNDLYNLAWVMVYDNLDDANPTNIVNTKWDWIKSL